VVDTKLEVVALHVSDIDRAKRFYESLGWKLDADFMIGKTFRAVQLTPPGSLCSVHLSPTGVPGSTQGTFLVVTDMQQARETLIRQGANVSEVFHYDNEHQPVPGPDARGDSYFTYATFKDPDGNGFVLQQVKTRLPGRGLTWDLPTLTDLLREAEHHHGQYEPTAPKHHWSGWYAAYVLARVQGSTPEQSVLAATRNIEGAVEPVRT
jgi:catechol 2,3-dioxygenase-like lactoylglutathione lyase family enzyme